MSRTKAFEYMLKTKKYSQEDMDKMKEKIPPVTVSKIEDSFNKVTVKQLKGFNYKDSSVPEGWGTKLKFNKGKAVHQTVICDPYGTVFGSRLRALREMLMLNSYSKSEIDHIKKFMQKRLIKKALRGLKGGDVAVKFLQQK